MKQFFRNNGGLIVLIAVLLTALLALGGYIWGDNLLTGALEGLAAPLRNVSTAVATWAQGQYDRTFQYESLLAENKTLRHRVAELEKAARKGEDAARENQRLENLLGLAEERPELTYRDASVTRRSTSNWASNLTIDRGSNSNVAVDQCVIDEYGNLVGVVTEVGRNWALVSTILDPNIEMGGRVVSSDENAIVEGDFTLMLEGLTKLSFLPDGAQLISGEQVTTSGLGGVYPPGLLIGSVVAVLTQEDGIGRYAKIQPAADIAGIQYVYVITDYGGEG